MPIEKQESASSILCLDSSPTHQHKRCTSHLQPCPAMQKTTTSWTEGEVSTGNPERRIVDSATTPVTAPATEECHQKPVENCRQGGCPGDADKGALCGEAGRKEAAKEKNQAEDRSSRHWRKRCRPDVSRHPCRLSSSIWLVCKVGRHAHCVSTSS